MVNPYLPYEKITESIISLYHNEQQYIKTLKNLSPSLKQQRSGQMFNKLVRVHQKLFDILSSQVDFDSRMLKNDLKCLTYISQWVFSDFSDCYLDYCIYFSNLQANLNPETIKDTVVKTLLKLPFVRYKSLIQFISRIYELTSKYQQIDRSDSKLATINSTFNRVAEYSNIQWMITKIYLNNQKLFGDYFQISYDSARKLQNFSLISSSQPPFDISQILHRGQFEMSLIHPKADQQFKKMNVELILVANQFYLDYEKLHILNTNESMDQFKRLKVFLANQTPGRSNSNDLNLLKLSLLHGLELDIDQLTVEQLADLHSSSVEQIFMGSTDFPFSKIDQLYIADIKNCELNNDQIGRDILFGNIGKDDFSILSINKGKREINLSMGNDISMKLKCSDSSMFYTWLSYFKYLFPYYHKKETVSKKSSPSSINALGIDFKTNNSKADENIFDDIQPLEIQNSISSRSIATSKLSDKSGSIGSRSDSCKSSRLSILSLEIENADIDTFINFLERKSQESPEMNEIPSSDSSLSCSSSSSSNERKNRKLSKSMKVTNFDTIFNQEDEDDWTTINSSSFTSSSSNRSSVKSRQQSTNSSSGGSLSNSTSFFSNTTNIIQEETEEDLNEDKILENIPENKNEEKGSVTNIPLSNCLNNHSDSTIINSKPSDINDKNTMKELPCTPPRAENLKDPSFHSNPSKVQMVPQQFSAFCTPSIHHKDSPKLLSPLVPPKKHTINPDAESSKSQVSSPLSQPPSIDISKRTFIHSQTTSYSASSENSSRGNSPITSVFMSASSPLKKFFSRKTNKRKQNKKRSSIVLNSGSSRGESNSKPMISNNVFNVNGTVLTNYEISKKKANFNEMKSDGYMSPDVKKINNKNSFNNADDDYQLTTLEKSPSYQDKRRLSYINGVSTKVSKCPPKRNSSIASESLIPKSVETSASLKSMLDSSTFIQKRDSKVERNRISMQKDILNSKQKEQLIDLLKSATASENKNSQKMITASHAPPSVLVFHSESPLGSPRFASVSIPNNYSVASLNNSSASSPIVQSNALINSVNDDPTLDTDADDIPIPKDNLILLPESTTEQNNRFDFKQLESFGKNYKPDLFTGNTATNSTSSPGANIFRKSSSFFRKPENNVNFEIVKSGKKELPVPTGERISSVNGGSFSVASALANYDKAITDVSNSNLKRKKSIDALKKIATPIKDTGKNVKGLKISTVLKNNNDSENKTESSGSAVTPAVVSVIDKYIAEQPRKIFESHIYEVLYWKSNNHWSKISSDNLIAEVSSCEDSERGYLSLYKQNSFKKPFVVLPVDKYSTITGPSVLEEHKYFVHLKSFNEINKKTNLISLQSSNLESLLLLRDSLRSTVETKDKSLINSRNQISNVSSVFDSQSHKEDVDYISRDTSAYSIMNSANELKSPMEYFESSHNSAEPFSPIYLSNSFKSLAINDEISYGTRKVRIHKKSNINGKWTPLAICLVDLYSVGQKSFSFRLCVKDSKTHNILLNSTVDGQRCKRIGNTGICIVAPTKDLSNSTRFNYLLESRNKEETEELFSILNHKATDE